MQVMGNTDQPAVTATSTPSFLQTTQQPSPKIMAPPGLSTAQQILQREGVSSSRELLDSMKVPSAQSILAGAGITSAKDILEKEGLKVQRQTALQNEMELRQKELEFMKNYKFDANTFNPTTYETKYGNLDFKEAKIGTGWGFDEHDANYTYQYVIDGKQYHFLPESVITKGVRGPDNKQLYNTGFLNKDTWAAMSEMGQLIDLSNMDTTALNPFETISTRTFSDDQKKTMQGRGFLFSAEDFEKFKTEYLNDTWGHWGSLSDKYGLAKGQYGGDIQGISQLPSGELIYVTQPSGGHDSVSTYINNQGMAWKHTYDKPSGFLADVGNFLNSVPLLPEIAVLATGGPASPLLPYYPAMKGSQVHAAGGDLGDVAASVVGATIATSPVMQNATASLTETFTPAFQSAATAEIAATAVVQAGFSGTMAALTGQDVGKAIAAGALSGGFQAGTPAIAEALFGDSATVGTLAESVGLTKAQFQNIVVSSMGNAAISAAVYDRDFTEMFTQSLVVNGLSQSAVNKVKASMKGKDSADIQRAVQGTKLVVQATARSAIRGTDINMELERALTNFTTGQVLSTASDFGQNK